jgi:hypothetical protein
MIATPDILSQTTATKWPPVPISEELEESEESEESEE